MSNNKNTKLKQRKSRRWFWLCFSPSITCNGKVDNSKKNEYVSKIQKTDPVTK